MSYTSLKYHVVFSTKQRKPFLSETKIQDIGRYTSGILKNLKGCLLIAGGVENHIHLAISLHPDSCISDVVRTVKSNTSRWIRETYRDCEMFSWQEGYSAFSVSYSGLDRVLAYIHGQSQHHKKMTFEEELIKILKKHRIEYNPEYVFG